MMFNFLKSDIISKREQKYLLDWAYQNENKFIPNSYGPHRKFYPYSQDFSSNAPDLLYEIKQRIIKKEKIKISIEEPMFGDYIGWISDGGFIHQHMDANIEFLHHVRYNLFLSVPYRGGNPIYNNKKIKVRERKYYRCNSGNEFHSSEKVIGDKPRIIVSYGFLIPF